MITRCFSYVSNHLTNFQHRPRLPRVTLHITLYCSYSANVWLLTSSTATLPLVIWDITVCMHVHHQLRHHIRDILFNCLVGQHRHQSTSVAHIAKQHDSTSASFPFDQHDDSFRFGTRDKLSSLLIDRPTSSLLDDKDDSMLLVDQPVSFLPDNTTNQLFSPIQRKHLF